MIKNPILHASAVTGVLLYSAGMLQDHLITIGKLQDDGTGGHTAPLFALSSGSAISISSLAFIANSVTGDQTVFTQIPPYPTRDWRST